MHSVSVDAWDLCAGYGHRYEISPKTIQITTLNDYGEKPRIVWESRLTEEQIKSFAAYLDRLPLGNLKERYDNPNISDGIGLNFHIGLTDGTKKTIEVHEVYQKDLAGVVERIDAIVPEKYQIGYEPRAQKP